MLTEDYRVRLDAFEGPLDLLLYLIRKAEVDVHDIPVAAITEQYLTYLEQIERIDIDAAGEFLVMAATLMEIKSRMLSPAQEAAASLSPGDTLDPRADLVRQLLAYKQFRDAADDLERRAEDRRLRFPASPAATDDAALEQALDADAPDLEDLDILDLVEAFRKISETVNFDRLGDHHVEFDDTPLELHAEDVLDQLRGVRGVTEGRAAGEVPFASIFRGRTRSEMIGLFLAMLHLVARRQVAVRQDRSDGSIYVCLRTEDDVPASPGSGEPSADAAP